MKGHSQHVRIQSRKMKLLEAPQDEYSRPHARQIGIAHKKSKQGSL